MGEQLAAQAAEAVEGRSHTAAEARFVAMHHTPLLDLQRVTVELGAAQSKESLAIGAAMLQQG